MTEPLTQPRATPGLAQALAAPPSRVALYGAQAHLLEAEFARHPNLHLVEGNPDVVVCYGGDGTLLSAEMRWPGLPKVPILNSRRGHRCIPHPPREVIAGLAEGRLVANVYTKLSSMVYRDGNAITQEPLLALNEINVHMGRVNSAVRFQLWINDEPYEEGLEVLGDGLVVCTPFGSTAYFSKITHGIFSKGIGIAFKATTEPVNHLVLPGSVVVRVQITRGPAVLAVDSSHDYIDLDEGDEIVTRKHPHGATILTCGPVRRLDEPF
jgi:NAD+ kinase